MLRTDLTVWRGDGSLYIGHLHLGAFIAKSYEDSDRGKEELNRDVEQLLTGQAIVPTMDPSFVVGGQAYKTFAPIRTSQLGDRVLLSPMLDLKNLSRMSGSLLSIKRNDNPGWADGFFADSDYIELDEQKQIRALVEHDLFCEMSIVDAFFLNYGIPWQLELVFEFGQLNMTGYEEDMEEEYQNAQECYPELQSLTPEELLNQYQQYCGNKMPLTRYAVNRDDDFLFYLVGKCCSQDSSAKREVVNRGKVAACLMLSGQPLDVGKKTAIAWADYEQRARKLYERTFRAVSHIRGNLD